MGCGAFSPQGGQGCYNGNVRGITFLNEAYKGSKQDLGLKATWDALAIAGGRTLLNAPDNEQTPDEIIATSLKFVADIPTGKKNGGMILRFVDNAYTKTLLDGLGNSADIFFHTDKDLILGLQTSVTDERKSISVQISPLRIVNGDLGLVELTLTYNDDFSRLEVATEFEAGFSQSDIPTWEGMQFGELASTATSLQFYVQDIAEIPFSDFDIANITLANKTDGGDVALLTQTLTENVVDLTFATLASKVVSPGYAVPTLSTDLYDVQKTFSTTLPV